MDTGDDCSAHFIDIFITAFTDRFILNDHAYFWLTDKVISNDCGYPRGSGVDSIWGVKDFLAFHKLISC